MRTHGGKGWGGGGQAKFLKRKIVFIDRCKESE